MEKIYQYWLANTVHLGSRKTMLLLSYFGSAYEIYHAKDKEIKGVKGIQEKDIQNLQNHRKAWDLEREYDLLMQKQIYLVSAEDENYPHKLRKIHNSPYALYVKGMLPKERIPSVAIIGARNCSEYGKYAAIEFSRILSENGVQIISGLARGIDGISQRTALEAGGNTFAVMGNGVDICYPEDNRNLYEEIPLHKGGIISQFPLSMKPYPKNFPMRNEIISGLSDMILIIEAKEKSGTLITADLALEQGKDVYAVPGRITDAFSLGCNQLLKQGAGIALNPHDLLTELGINPTLDIKVQKKTNNSLESTEKLLYSCLDLYPKGLHEILEEMSMPMEELIHTLITLEIKGYIKEISKNYYIKTMID